MPLARTTHLEQAGERGGRFYRLSEVRGAVLRRWGARGRVGRVVIQEPGCGPGLERLYEQGWVPTLGVLEHRVGEVRSDAEGAPVAEAGWLAGFEASFEAAAAASVDIGEDRGARRRIVLVRCVEHWRHTPGVEAGVLERLRSGAWAERDGMVCAEVCSQQSVRLLEGPLGRDVVTTESRGLDTPALEIALSMLGGGWPRPIELATLAEAGTLAGRQR